MRSVWTLSLLLSMAYRASAQEIATLKPEGPTASTEIVALAPDGKTVFMSGFNGHCALWDIARRRAKATLAGHNGKPIVAAVWSPDGKHLATASFDNSVKLWDAATQKEFAILKGHDNLLRAIAISPDSKMLVSSSQDKTVRLWTMAGEAVRTLPAQQDIHGPVESLAFSPDGKTIAGADPFFGIIYLWETASGKALGALKQEGCKALSFTADGKLAVGTRDGILRIWDLQKKEVATEFKGHDGAITAVVALAIPGSILATGGADGTVRLWDLTAKKESAVLKGHPHEIKSLSASADGKILVSGSEGRTVKVWDVVRALGR